MSSRDMLREELKSPEARRDYAAILLSSSLALQIKVLRQQRGWSQEELAQRAGLHQSQISAMEQTGNEAWTLRKLKKLAEAFDLALIVRFESFGTLLEEALSISRTTLERPSFEEDAAFRDEEALQPSDTTVATELLAPIVSLRSWTAPSHRNPLLVSAEIASNG